jgi:antitoxin component YwqK of YwqJK toxin-antitoxin module
MKKIPFYLLAIATILLTTSGTLKDNLKDIHAEKTIQNSQFVRAWGSAYTTVYNQSGNVVTKVEVNTVTGSQTFLYPTFPLYFPANGNVTVTVYFKHTNVDGVMKSFKSTSSGWVETNSEDYNTNYLCPITYSPVGPEGDEVIIY